MTTTRPGDGRPADEWPNDPDTAAPIDAGALLMSATAAIWNTLDALPVSSWHTGPNGDPAPELDATIDAQFRRLTDAAEQAHRERLDNEGGWIDNEGGWIVYDYLEDLVQARIAVERHKAGTLRLDDDHATIGALPGGSEPADPDELLEQAAATVTRRYDDVLALLTGHTVERHWRDSHRG